MEVSRIETVLTPFENKCLFCKGIGLRKGMMIGPDQIDGLTLGIVLETV